MIEKMRIFNQANRLEKLRQQKVGSSSVAGSFSSYSERCIIAA